MNVPTLTDASPREMLREAIGYLKTLATSASERADLFEDLAKQIEAKSRGAWQAARNEGTDGSYIFIGRVGCLLIIGPDGKLYRGQLQQAHISPIVQRGKLMYTIRYDLLKEI